VQTAERLTGTFQTSGRGRYWLDTTRPAALELHQSFADVQVVFPLRGGLGKHASDRVVHVLRLIDRCSCQVHQGHGNRLAHWLTIRAPVREPARANELDDAKGCEERRLAPLTTPWNAEANQRSSTTSRSHPLSTSGLGSGSVPG